MPGVGALVCAGPAPTVGGPAAWKVVGLVRQVDLHLIVVVPDDMATSTVLGALSGRELPSAPGSWIADVTLAEDCATTPEPDPFAVPQDVLDAEADADAGLDVD